MQRILYNQLIKWKNSQERLPLLLRGARQVGKSYLAQALGEAEFKQVIAINFELQPHLKQAFDSLNPADILRSLELLLGIDIQNDSLLFLDEIQECPQAIQALRYFKEQMPEQAVIGAGSLLEFAIEAPDFRMPVGRVAFMRLHPMTFKEFLWAVKEKPLASHLAELNFHNLPSSAVHDKLLNLLKTYFITGGMPAAIQHYVNQDSFEAAREHQEIILSTYRNDFGKYANLKQQSYLQLLFDQLPKLAGQAFKYSKISTDIQSRDLKLAVQLLENAGLLYRVFASNASGLPLRATTNLKKFKTLMLDLGLMLTALGTNPSNLLSDDLLLINRGALAEQFVGQELLAYDQHILPRGLFYWQREERNSTAEVDYLLNYDERIMPIEVKAGSTGRLKSLRLLMQEKQLPVGIKVCSEPLSFSNAIATIPLYMLSELERLVNEL